MGHKIIFAILLFSLSGLLVPPISTQPSSETSDFTLNDSIPSAYATSLTNIEKLAAYKIHLKIRVTEIPGELEELEKKGPTTSWYKSEAREKAEWEQEKETLEEELARSKIMLKKVCTWIDLYERNQLGTGFLDKQVLNLIKLPETIGLAQSLTKIYLDMVQDILTGDLNIDTFCELLEIAIKTAEAVGDEELAKKLHEISEIAMAVKDANGTLSDLKKALEDKKNTVGLGASNIFEDISDTESDDENLLAANNDTVLPGWFKNNIIWVQQGLLPKSSLLPAIENLMIQNVIPIDRFIKPAGTEGNIGGGYAQQVKGYGISSAPISSSLPDYSVTVLGLWANGQISSGEVGNHLGQLMSSGVINSERIQKEITERKSILHPPSIQRQIDPPSLQLDSGPSDVNPETAQLVFETTKQNEVSMSYLLKIKSAEHKMIKNAYDDALNDYSENENQDTMNIMVSLGNAEKKAKDDSLRTVKILKKTVQLAKDAKAAAVGAGLDVLDLEALVVDQQFEIDAMSRHFETKSEIKSAYKDVLKSQKKADKGLQNVLLSIISSTAQFQQLSTADQNSVSAEIGNIGYSDFRIATVPCDTQSSLGLPANFILGLKIPYAFGDGDTPCENDDIDWIQPQIGFAGPGFSTETSFGSSGGVSFPTSGGIEFGLALPWNLVPLDILIAPEIIEGHKMIIDSDNYKMIQVFVDFFDDDWTSDDSDLPGLDDPIIKDDSADDNSFVDPVEIPTGPPAGVKPIKVEPLYEDDPYNTSATNTYADGSEWIWSEFLIGWILVKYVDENGKVWTMDDIKSGRAAWIPFDTAEETPSTSTSSGTTEETPPVSNATTYPTGEIEIIIPTVETEFGVQSSGGGEIVKKVTVLIIGGNYYPKSQFFVADPDICESLHYHAGTVYSIQGTSAYETQGECGFGGIGTIPVEVYHLTQEDIDSFHELTGIDL